MNPDSSIFTSENHQAKIQMMNEFRRLTFFDDKEFLKGNKDLPNNPLRNKDECIEKINKIRQNTNVLIPKIVMGNGKPPNFIHIYMLLPVTNVDLSNIENKDPIIGIMLTKFESHLRFDVYLDDILSKMEIEEIEIEEETMILRFPRIDYSIGLDPMLEKLVGLNTQKVSLIAGKAIGF